MKSVKLQLLVTLAAVLAATGIFVTKGCPSEKALHEVAADGDLGQVHRTLDWGVAVDGKLDDDSGRTPLGTAAPLFILAGQSNMGGYGDDSELPPGLSETQNAQIWVNGVWQPVTPGYGAIPGYFGPELMLATELPGAYFVKVAQGATSLAVDWNPGTGAWYSQLIQQATAARATMDNPTIPCLFWMQGEQDARHEDMANAYGANLLNFAKRIRADLGIPDLPIVFGRIKGPFDAPWRDTVRAQMAWATTVDLLLKMIDTDDLPLRSDNLHYDTRGQIMLGERFAQEYSSILIP